MGVTTLVGGVGCPLDCAYCLNPQCKIKPWKSFDVEGLFEAIVVDSLYFAATGGGVCFGGGEPLLQAEFIREFIEYAKNQGRDWKFTLETCLAVPLEKLRVLDGLIDFYIVDIKDMDREIYQKYTGQDNEKLLRCLTHLAKNPDKVLIKIPLIPGYNGMDSIEKSKLRLADMGFWNFNTFRYITKIKKAEILSKKGIDTSAKQ